MVPASLLLASEVQHEELNTATSKVCPSGHPQSHTCSYWIFHKGHCHCDSFILDPLSVFMSYLLTVSAPLKLSHARHTHLYTPKERKRQREC